MKYNYNSNHEENRQIIKVSKGFITELTNGKTVITVHTEKGILDFVCDSVLQHESENTSLNFTAVV